MKIKGWHLLILMGLLVLSFMPLFPDPYYHEERVNFWVWLHREIQEVHYGERD